MELETCGFTPEERRTAIALHRDGYVVLDFPDPDLDARIERIKARLSPLFGDHGVQP
jgi:hypothetical protein